MSFEKDLKLAFILIITAGMSMVYGIESPIGSTTVPQSSSQRGLSASRQPGIYSSTGTTTGNDVVTGNVSGFKSFRGVVPYGSPYYFQGQEGEGSASLQRFLRNSSGTGYENDRNPARIPTYISPERAVTGIQGSRPLNSQVYSKPSTSLKQAGYNTYGLVPLEEAQKLIEPKTPNISPLSRQINSVNLRPLTTTPSETEDYISQAARLKLQPSEQEIRKEEQKREQFQQELQELKAKTAELKEKITEPEEPATPEKVENQLTAQQVLERNMPKVSPNQSIFEQMRERSQKEFKDNLRTMQLAKEQAGDQNQVAEPNKPWGYLTAGQQKAILGYSKTFAAESKDKFNQLMKAAELYLKSKQFYKAADAYTLASTYEPGNPLPYAGKCHALFGAGEYMSSAYWLARAIEVYPDYPRFKIDLASMLGGDKDLIQSRIAEITQWQEKTGSGELLMLLSYVYFELGEVEQATMAINGAKVKMPESKAVNMLDEVIHLAGQQGNQPAPEPSNMVTEPNQP